MVFCWIAGATRPDLVGERRSIIQQSSNPAIQQSIRAVFFDLDDTLCGYWEAAKTALRETFEQHGPPGHDVDTLTSEWAAAFREFLPEVKSERWYKEYLRSGETTRTEQMRRSLLRFEIDDPEQAARLSRVYLELRHKHLHLFPDAIQILTALRGQYVLGLITNGPADTQRMEIDELAIGEYFDHIFIEGEMGFGKPEPEVFRRAQLASGSPPDQILFVGNSYGHDILPAIRAGWRTAWIRRPTDIPPSMAGAAPRLEQRSPDQPEPDLEIGTLSELLPWLAARR